MSKTSAEAEIFLLKFKPDLKEIEATIRITNNNKADIYPDAWVAGGDTAVLENFAQQPADAKKKIAEDWPSSKDGCLFAWARADAENLLPGRRTSCRATAKGMARYGRGRQMLLDGGYYLADEVSEAAVAAEIQKSGAITVEFILTEIGTMTQGAEASLFVIETTATEPGIILECLRKGEELVLRSGGGDEASLRWDFEVLKPRHLVVRMDKTGISAWLDGQERSVSGNLMLTSDASGSCRIRFGDPSANLGRWAGLLENVAIFAGTVDDGKARQMHELSKPVALPPASRLRVRGRLIQAMEPEISKLGSYQRMLIGQTYEVEEILSGKCGAGQVVVMQWGILDRQLVSGLPKELGSEQILELEPLDSHPGLSSELQEIASDSLENEVYVDISRPKL